MRVGDMDSTHYQYLSIYSDGIPVLSGVPLSTSASFTPSPAGLALLLEWIEADPATDSYLSGVLADWLEDHWDELMDSGRGDACCRRLQSLVHRLRSRFAASQSP